MAASKVIGYTLLAIGLLAIGYALFSSYGIFVQADDPPEVLSIAQPEQKDAAFDMQNIEESMEALMQEQLGSIIPADTISKTLNLFAWSIFAGILIFGGAQIAGLGVKLLRIPNQENPN